MTTVTRASWAKSLLQSLEVPLTDTNIRIIMGWEQAEGGAGPQFGIPTNKAAYNPLNTKQAMPKQGDTAASTDSGGGIQAYNSWSQGLKATVITISQANFKSILSMLETGTSASDHAATVIDGSAWGTHDLTEALIDCQSGSAGGRTIPAVRPGGAAGLGGTGTTANGAQVSPWIVGDSSNPDQDYWTTINQYTQEAQWYCFSDGESLYVADGVELMAQTPALMIHRADQRVLSLNLTWDNTSFQFAVTRRAEVGVQRRATLSRTTSPTQATLKLICDIDDYRAGDVIYLLGCGPGDGPWLLGDCQRSIFQPYSTMTLVQGAMPLSAETGESIGPNLAPTKTASAPGARTRMAAMMTEAMTLNRDDYPYVWGGGHLHAGVPDIGRPGGNGYNGVRKGFDCSGGVAAVLAAGGIGFQTGDSVPSDAGVIQVLQKTGVLLPGEGAGQPEVTLYDNPGVHIFMRLNGDYWGTDDSAGHLPDTSNEGPGWIPNGVGSGPGFTAYHISASTLREYVSGKKAGVS